MKRLFTIAVVAMTAALTFAQAPLAKKHVVSGNKLERLDVKGLAQKAKETKEMRAAMAEKEAAAKQTSSSLLRKSSVNRSMFNSFEGKVIKTWISGGFRNELANKPYKSNARKTTTQEGNVTVTTDANGIITDVAGVEPKMYLRATTGTAYYYSESVKITTQSGTVTIIEDGNNVYIKNPITRYTTEAWVKGTKSGNAITVPTRQPLMYNTKYETTISLRWGVITAEGKLQAADDHAEAFTFTVNGNVLTLEGTAKFTGEADAYYMGAYWDDDNSATGFGDAETILTYDPDYVAPSTELVTLPTGAEYTGWYMNGTSLSSDSETPIKNRSVNVSVFGNEIYVQGISESFPTAWVKGTIDGTTVKFDKFQYVGQYSSYDCWFIGVGIEGENAVIKDAVATYDAEAKTITFVDDVLINADAFKISYLNWFANLVISAEKTVIEEPIITDQTATLPYTNTFDTDTEQFQAAVYDANEDLSTFSFEKYSSASENMVARYRYSTSNKADDYLVFPGIELKAGTKYKISLDAASYSASYPERLEVVAGKVAKASQLTIPVIAATEVATKDFIKISNNAFTVDEDGTYYIAVHAISDKNQFYLYVDNFSISEIDAEAPATVSDLSVVADAQGANKATVTFTVPAQTVSGTAITEAVNVVVKRDGEEIFSGAKTAGESVAINDDNVPAAGYHIYSVEASYGSHEGEPAEIKVYVGYDTPDVVSNIIVADKSNSVAITWEAPTKGENGFIINPADFKYNIYPVEIVEFWGMQFPSTDYENPYATGLTETSANIAYNTNEGEQGFTYFAVTAENTTGESDDTYGAVVTGAPYQIPFIESVAGGGFSHWWGYAADVNNQALDGGVYLGETSSDGDGYCLLLAAETAGWVELHSGKIALAGAVNPVLTFDCSANKTTPLTVYVITPNGMKEINTLTAGTDFAPATVALAEFANEDWVRVIISATFDAAGEVNIDNIRIYNQLDNNLVAESITATSKVLAGEDVTINVTVENQGSKTAEAGAYQIDLYCNDAKVKSLPGTALESNAKTTFTFTEATNVMTPTELIWKAVVEFAADEDKNNNTTATAKTTIKTNSYPAVNDLAGKQTDNTVSLTWSEPDMNATTAEPVTDSFEDYEAFAVNAAGDWSFIDVDGSKTYGIEGVNFPNAGSEMAYIVLDGTHSEFNQSFAAHTGNKYMACFAAGNGPNDDWMISPELSGTAQSVSFFARTYTDQYGAESFEFYYSTTGKSVADFVKVATVAEVPTDWTEYTFDIPEGAKYFAIRCTSNDKFIFLVDDVTYTPAGTPSDLAIVGYNVYRDGIKLNAEPVEEPNYTDATVTDGEHTYAVTVVYDKGESKISNIVTISVTNGINGIAANAAKISVSKQTITVTNAEGENVSIYTMDGKTVYNAEGATVTNIRVENGVYIVKVGNNTVKTVVK